MLHNVNLFDVTYCTETLLVFFAKDVSTHSNFLYKSKEFPEAKCNKSYDVTDRL